MKFSMKIQYPVGGGGWGRQVKVYHLEFEVWEEDQLFPEPDSDSAKLFHIVSKLFRVQNKTKPKMRSYLIMML